MSVKDFTEKEMESIASTFTFAANEPDSPIDVMEAISNSSNAEIDKAIEVFSELLGFYLAERRKRLQ